MEWEISPLPKHPFVILAMYELLKNLMYQYCDPTPHPKPATPAHGQVWIIN